MARLAVAGGLTAYILWTIEPRAALAALARADWRWAAAAVALVLVDRALNAYRWLVLLRPLAGARPPLDAVLRVFFISTFVGTFLPASVGGEAVRAVALARHGVGMADSVASVLADRVLGALSILIVGGVAAVFAPASVPGWLAFGTGAAAVAACVAIALGLFSDRADRVARSLLHRWTRGRILSAASSLLESLRRYAHSIGVLLNVLGGSIAVQVLRIVQAWLLGLALGLALGPAVYFVYIPIILLIMLVPVTINGIGTSQAAFVWLFAESGVAAADAFALSVLFVGLGVVGNLPGGILYARGGVMPNVRQPTRH
jgi:glycosyltransferase 2 family protein